MTLEPGCSRRRSGSGVWRNVLIKERPGGEVYNLYSNVDIERADGVRRAQRGARHAARRPRRRPSSR